MEKTVRLRIRGQVQGVGYRAFVQTEAERLGLRGWVRNRRDGSVEAVASGPAGAIDELLIAVRRGPAGGSVESVGLEEGDAAALDVVGSAGAVFVVLPTL